MALESEDAASSVSSQDKINVTISTRVFSDCAGDASILAASQVPVSRYQDVCSGSKHGP